MRSFSLAVILVAFSGAASAQQPSQVYLYCMNGQVDLRLTKQSEGRSVCLIRSFGHETSAREWARHNLADGRRCSCN